MNRRETHSRRLSPELAAAATADGSGGAERRSSDLMVEQDGSNDTVPLLHTLPLVGGTPLTLSLAASLDSHDLASGYDEGDTKSSWYLFLLTLSIGG